ncbi:MATE family efflux transporter [Anaerotardibacter muris]|uniref:MATE family efflux transporter n=1 Tax=Anaerotardibacter muris TaxID=2941505 RepID=UPI002041643B|nr:MATE family efflux transporter [Anaerotardibacter muris]
MKHSIEYWFLEAPVSRAILHMALPMMLGMAAMSIYNFTDLLFIGALGDTAALAAIPLAMPVMAIFIGLSTFLEIGVGTFISRKLGAQERAAARGGSSFAVFAALGLGLLAGIALIAFIDPVLAILGANAEIYEVLKGYLIVYCCGAPFVVLAMVGAQLLRSITLSKQASAGLVLSAVVNIALDPIFIFVFGMGLQGAAIATIIANIATCVYFLLIISGNEALSLNPLDCCALRKKDLADIGKVGSSAFIMLIMMGGAALIFNNVAVSYGTAVVAGFGIAQTIVQLLEVITMGLYEGVVPLIAGAWGAKRLDRVKNIVRMTAFYLVGFCALLCTILIMNSSMVAGWFSADETVITIGAVIICAQALALVFDSGSGLITGIFQACSKGIASNAMAIARGVMLPICIVAGSVLFGLDGAIWSLLAASLFTFALGMIFVAITFRKSGKDLVADDSLTDGIQAEA